LTPDQTTDAQGRGGRVARERHPNHFTDARAVAAEGARVAFVSCLRCGAVILIDPADDEDMAAIHKHWHLALEHRFFNA
jgi:hypothetical protein